MTNNKFQRIIASILLSSFSLTGCGRMPNLNLKKKEKLIKSNITNKTNYCCSNIINTFNENIYYYFNFYNQNQDNNKIDPQINNNLNKQNQDNTTDIDPLINRNLNEQNEKEIEPKIIDLMTSSKRKENKKKKKNKIDKQATTKNNISKINPNINKKWILNKQNDEIENRIEKLKDKIDIIKDKISILDFSKNKESLKKNNIDQEIKEIEKNIKEKENNLKKDQKVEKEWTDYLNSEKSKIEEQNKFIEKNKILISKDKQCIESNKKSILNNKKVIKTNQQNQKLDNICINSNKKRIKELNNWIKEQKKLIQQDIDCIKSNRNSIKNNKVFIKSWTKWIKENEHLYNTNSIVKTKTINALKKIETVKKNIENQNNNILKATDHIKIRKKKILKEKEQIINNTRKIEQAQKNIENQNNNILKAEKYIQNSNKNNLQATKHIKINTDNISKSYQIILEKLKNISKAKEKKPLFISSINKNQEYILDFQKQKKDLLDEKIKYDKNIQEYEKEIDILKIQTKKGINNLNKFKKEIQKNNSDNDKYLNTIKKEFLKYNINDFNIDNIEIESDYENFYDDEKQYDSNDDDIKYNSAILSNDDLNSENEIFSDDDKNYDDELFSDDSDNYDDNIAININEYQRSILKKFPKKIYSQANNKLNKLNEDKRLQILNFLENRDLFYPEIIKNYNSEEWIVESLILDITSIARSKNSIFEIEKFYDLINKLKSTYSTDEVKGILFFIKNKGAFKKLSFIEICNVIDFLNCKSPNSLGILLDNSENWFSELISDCLKTKLNLPNESENIYLLSKYIHELKWDTSLTFSFLKGIKNKKTLLEGIQFLKLATSKYITEADIRAAIKNPRKNKQQKSLIKKWQNPIEHIIIKNVLDNIVKIDNPEIKEKVARLVYKNTSIEYILNFLKYLSINKKKINISAFIECLDIIYDFDLNEDETFKAFNIILTYDHTKWTKKIHDIAIKATFKEEHERTLDELIDYIYEKNPNVNIVKNNQNLKSLFNSIENKLKSNSVILKNNKKIEDWDKNDIKKWTEKSVEFTYDQSSFFLGHNKDITKTRCKTKAPLIETIAVIKRAIKLIHGYYPRKVQILSLLIMLNKENNKNRLAQINTGEGKSCIIAMLAAIKALITGKSIDIVTTSTELSIPESNKQTPFFEMLGLTVAENSTRDEDKKKEIYKKDIVYGKVADFMGNKLRDKSENKSIIGKRDSILIIDEVDSMFIDGRNSRVELSSPLPGMQHLEIVLASIWSHINNLCTHFVEQNGKFYYCTEEVKHDKSSGEIMISGNKDNINEETMYPIEDWQKFIKEKTIEHITKLLGSKNNNYPTLDIPNHLRKFAKSQIEVWVKNAIYAKFYFLKERDYDIDISKSKIIPIDIENTGELQRNTVWSNGLEQFLQLKEGLRITGENICADFISNVKFFKSYKEKYGLTGTLGSEASKSFLGKIYNTDFVTIPPFNTIEISNNQDSNFICKELPAIIVKNNEEWLKEIIKTSTREAKCKRGVLILCKYIDDVKKLEKLIKENYDAPNKVHIYTGQLDFNKDTIAAGEIIIATNIAGRGTDITPSDYVNENGGMHVIITFKTKNSRVEKQNGGRTGRKGEPGTVQSIILNNKNQTIEEIRKERDEKEKEEIEKAFEEVKKIELRDTLFERYCSLKNSICTGSKNTSNHKNAIKERYGIFMNDIQQIIDKSENFDKKQYDNILNKYNDFENEIKSLNINNSLIANPYYHIHLGNNKMVGKIKDIPFGEVINEYNKAINLDPNRALHAHYNKAYAILLRSGKRNSQKRAKSELLKAKDLIKTQYLPSLLSFNTLVNQFNTNKTATQQIQHHMNILGQQEAYIDRAIAFIDKALDNDWEVDVETETLKEIFSETETDHTKEIEEVNNNGLWELFTLKKRPPPTSWWSIFAVGLIGLGQIFLGAAITVFSVGAGSQIGLGLISEGVSDIITAVKAGIKGGGFSWKDWSIQKAISLAVSVITAGIGAVKDALKATKEAIKNGISAIKTGVTELTKEGWKAAAKQVGIALGKGIAKEVITSLADYALEETLLKDIEKEIEQVVSKKIYEALQNNPLIAEGIKLDLNTKNNYWQNLFITKGLDLLKDKKTNVWLNSLSQVAQGIASAKVPGLGSAIQATKMAKALSDLAFFTDDFVSNFNSKIKQYQKSIKEEVELQKQLEENKQSLQNDSQEEEKQSTQEIHPQFYKPSKSSRIHNIFTNNITCKMTGIVNHKLIKPTTSTLSNMSVDYISSSATKSINDEMLNYKCKRKIKLSQDKIAKTKKIKSYNTDKNIDIHTLNFVYETLEDGNGSILHLGAFSKEFDCPIEVYNEEGKLCYIIGEDNPGNPIKLEYQKPNNSNKNGHWNPLGVKIKSKNGNCLYDSIGYLKNKKASELRQIAGDCIVSNIDLYKKNIPAIQRLQMNGNGSLYAGGGALAFTADKLMLLEDRYNQLIKKYPKTIKYLKGGKKAFDIGRLLYKVTPASFAFGVLIDYTTEQFLKPTTNPNFKKNLINLLLKADKDLNNKTANYLANKIIKIARAGGRSVAYLGVNVGLNKGLFSLKKNLKKFKRKQPKDKWNPRIEKRINEDPGCHEFPVSFDEHILNTKPVKLKNNRLGYAIKGNINVNGKDRKRIFNIILDENGKVAHRDMISTDEWISRQKKWDWNLPLDKIEGKFK